MPGKKFEFYRPCRYTEREINDTVLATAFAIALMVVLFLGVLLLMGPIVNMEFKVFFGALVSLLAIAALWAQLATRKKVLRLIEELEDALPT